MKLDLENKVALVTASSAGIGLEIAHALAAEGASVVINGRTQASVDSSMAELRARLPEARLIPLAADNGTAEGCAETLRLLPSVDILVNNLGIYEAVGFFDESDADWQQLFEVNIMSGVRLARHYLQGMLERGNGRVVFISSESGVSPAPEMAHYSATKTMQLSISRALAELTKGSAVTVNAVLPGPTRTAGVEKFIADVFPGLPPAEAQRKFMAENRPSSLIGRLIDPKEIGDIVAFICSPRAAVINGACIRAEGGLVRSAF
ncbi:MULTISPECIES: SDR family NAD(P)-dependent oxidoreductase [Gammaproteobacteria]|uniref:SDR family NAD(P)-dependent oxidoreductase n=1 Tax=Gammaproteobacteria TaxID=1236 RepID=UPI001C62AAAE|nr:MULTISPECIES: SDR family oxidoreductase [Gammaproteobacteria]MEE1978939.1 SDR family oxidoreductase [Shewanella xiamenensis]QYH28446.1 SDR family oxidoreductase [Aeromonas salmonicida subsp. masoucida]